VPKTNSTVTDSTVTDSTARTVAHPTSEPATGEARPDAAPAVQVVELRKRYPKSPIDAVGGVSFSVSRGEVFGLLGPNGAGKTTTIGILTTRVRPTSGKALVKGIDVVADPVAARRVLAVVPQRSNLDRALSVRQNLTFHASYHGVPKQVRDQRATALLEQFGLGDRGKEKPDFFSGGQAQRMMIARALMHAPGVLFLDEPSTGLDPAMRLFVWDRIRELRASGTTVVLTTHDKDEAAALADRVGIMDRGQLLALDTPAALISQLPGERTLDVRLETGDLVSEQECSAAISQLAGVKGVEPVADAGGPSRVRLSVQGEAATFVAPVAQALVPLGARLAGVSLGEPSLEDVFIHLTGRALR